MKTLIEEQGLISLEEAAKYLGVTPRTFSANYSNKLNDVKRILGSRCYFPKEALKRFLTTNNTQN